MEKLKKSQKKKLFSLKMDIVQIVHNKEEKDVYFVKNEK